MTPEKTDSPTPLLPFDTWKAQLRQDCERNDTLAAYYAFTDFVLKMLWQDGFAPTCEAIVQGHPKPN